MTSDRPHDRERPELWLLIFMHIVVCCVSLIRVAAFRSPAAFNPATFHIFFDVARLPTALLATGAFAFVAPLFVLARFSFGYLVGFYFYTAALGYLWLQSFTDLNYDHRVAGFSVAVSAIAFLMPALFMKAPLRRSFALTVAWFDRLLLAIIVLGAATVAIGATYYFRLASISDIYDFRNEVVMPRIVNYAIGMTLTSLLPFAFAGLVFRKAYWQAAAALALLICLYPVTLSKLALFAPLWLITILILSRLFNTRSAVVLSLLLPVLVTLLLAAIFPEKTTVLFSVVNFRMIAIPAAALDVYSDFFSSHKLTYFCQISLLKPFMHCPYQEQLSLVMERAYKIGNFNASLFATEGIASVGFYLAPLAILVCGVIIGFGNRASAGLPGPFVLLSGAMLPQVLLNVPLSTVLLTHGGALLFLLWYLTPRSIFDAASPAIDAPGRSN